MESVAATLEDLAVSTSLAWEAGVAKLVKDDDGARDQAIYGGGECGFGRRVNVHV
jgi:hypothetical protein